MAWSIAQFTNFAKYSDIYKANLTECQANLCFCAIVPYGQFDPQSSGSSLKLSVSGTHEVLAEYGVRKSPP
ncbi:MAG: hypothetical protein HEQ19_26465 [Gloeotrichia echinulata CP02]